MRGRWNASGVKKGFGDTRGERREEGGKGDERDESARKLQLHAINVH